MMTVSAAVRLIPTPPARVERRKMNDSDCAFGRSSEEPSGGDQRSNQKEPTKGASKGAIKGAIKRAIREAVREGPSEVITCGVEKRSIAC